MQILLPCLNFLQAFLSSNKEAMRGIALLLPDFKIILKNPLFLLVPQPFRIFMAVGAGLIFQKASVFHGLGHARPFGMCRSRRNSWFFKGGVIYKNPPV